jgi:hypothetical protein
MSDIWELIDCEGIAVLIGIYQSSASKPLCCIQDTPQKDNGQRSVASKLHRQDILLRGSGYWSLTTVFVVAWMRSFMVVILFLEGASWIASFRAIAGIGDGRPLVPGSVRCQPPETEGNQG